MSRIVTCGAVAALLAALAGCTGESTTGPVEDGGLSCAASQQSGIWMLPFGPVSQEVIEGGKAEVTVIVMQRSESQQGEGKAVAGHKVTFRIITPGGDASLESNEVTTDPDGLATVRFVAGKQAQLYQVEASSQGTCNQTFTLDVREQLRQLRAVTPSPFDTFTNSRIPIAVEATTNAAAKLQDEAISFTITLGKSGQTKISRADGSGTADKVEVKTDVSGRATVMLATGSTPIPQLKVVATMAGTAPAEVVVRIAKGQNKGCTNDWDCPLGYTCKGGVCQAPPTTPPSGCKSDADCAAPTICHVASGKCMEPTGATCDPIEGTGCKADEVCIGNKCAKVPSGCTDNSNCPPTWICKSGKCQPQGTPPSGGCKKKSDCPSGNVCINGKCVPKSACNIPHAKDRLKGNWRYTSMLHFRQALNPVLKGILGASGMLRDIIEGRFKISGIPSFISSLVSKYLKKLIDKYIPPWGQQLITALGDINDIVDDMKVVSTVQTTSVGNDAYVNSEKWDLVEFDYKGKKISTPPHAVPQIGQVKIPSYSSYEVCGVLFINKHKVNNVVGGLVQWAINTVLSAVTCSIKSTPCYSSVDQALQQVINCQALGMQIDQMVHSVWSSAPSVAMLVINACNSEKQNLIQLIKKELAAITTKLSLLELSGTSKIPNPPGHNKLTGGKWYGVLGSGAAKGNFDGEFDAVRMP